MEALVALAVACNLTQLIGQSLTVAAVIKQIYDEGSTHDHKQSYALSQSLQSILAEIRKEAAQSDGIPQSSMDKTIHKIAQDSEEICAKLCSELDKLNGSAGYRSAVLTGLRTLRKRSTIQKLQEGLRQQKALLDTGVLISLRDQVRVQSLLTAKQSDDLDTLLTLCADSKDTNKSQIQSLTTSLLGQITKSQTSLENRIDGGFETLRSDATSRELKNRLLQSLRFPEMNLRINQIHEREPGTFEWILQTSENSSTTKSQHSFASWLSSGKDIYWIQGKAGSGKSTLMKFLWQDPRTSEHLTRHKPHKDALILKYSFWLSGSLQQRSLDGCYRCLLHQLLEKKFEDALSVPKNSPDLVTKRFEGDWTSTGLQDTLLAAITVVAEKIVVCIFLDGLDELEGRDRFPMFVKFLRQLCTRPQVKLCVSSRPENYWYNQFKEDPQLRLQDLVDTDIRNYITARFEDAGYSGQGIGDSYMHVVNSICMKAEGVFLWVHLAMRPILQALDGKASWSEVEEMIDLMPTELADLYESMLAKQGALTSRIRQEAATYFKLCLSGYLSTMIDFVSIKLRLDGKDPLSPDITLEDFYNTAQDIKSRISYVCAGMVVCVESRQASDDQEINPLHVFIHFFHRTVKDFLTDFEVGKALMKSSALTDDEILQTWVRGHLQHSLLSNDLFRPETLGLCILIVLRLSLNATLNFSSEAVIRALETMDNKFTCSSSGDVIVSERIDQCSDKARIEVFSTQPKIRRRPGLDWFIEVWHCIDVVGLSLTVGLKDYVDHLTSRYTSSPPANAITFTSSYKDYLLLCAVKGLWQEGTLSPGTIMTLIEAGGNPFAELFLPVWQPRRRCAAAELVWRIYFVGSRILVKETSCWVSLLKKIIDMRCDSLTFLFLNLDLSRCPNLLDDFMLDLEVDHQTEEAQQFWLLLPTLIVSQLERILLYSRSLLKTKPKCVFWFAPVFESPPGSLWVCGGDESRSPPPQWMMALAGEESMHIEKRVKALYEKLPSVLDSNESDPLQNKAAWKDAEELASELSALWESKPISERVDANTFWRMHGYTVDKSDPRVWQGSFARFEPVTKAHMKKKGDPGERESAELEQEDLAESSDAEFFDAHE